MTYFLPDGGRIEHVMCHGLMPLRREADRLFQEFQKGGVDLRRWRFLAHRVKGFLTQNFSFNAGEAYRHSVDLPATPLSQSPLPVREAHALMQSLSSTELNEVLCIGYMTGQKMSFHDDGEKEVNGPIVGWSLGSDCIMRFRRKVPKKRRMKEEHGGSLKRLKGEDGDVVVVKVEEGTFKDKPGGGEPVVKMEEDVMDVTDWRGVVGAGDGDRTIDQTKSLGGVENEYSGAVAYHQEEEGGQAETSKRRAEPNRVVLKLLLKHGDVVTMYGKEVQRHYEHAVMPQGLRFGITARRMTKKCEETSNSVLDDTGEWRESDQTVMLRAVDGNEDAVGGDAIGRLEGASGLLMLRDSG
ncbi:hypothetical protein HDV00_002456 [Rhizophlyctis rosea]|nr:hypothetical protein HDV00_002456 [Rhizophlyctis rosea]